MYVLLAPLRTSSCRSSSSLHHRHHYLLGPFFCLSLFLPFARLGMASSFRLFNFAAVFFFEVRSALRCFGFLPSETLKLVSPFFLFLGWGLVRGDPIRSLFASFWFVFALFLACWVLAPGRVCVCVCVRGVRCTLTPHLSCRGGSGQSLPNKDTAVEDVKSTSDAIRTYLHFVYIATALLCQLYSNQVVLDTSCTRTKLYSKDEFPPSGVQVCVCYAAQPNS